ncbi:MAG TPA: hypothetical protein VHA11_06990 [Bryobacteraceae bacterium]|nr:hypothetical protein [Bryobacteraceae bacterium]
MMLTLVLLGLSSTPVPQGSAIETARATKPAAAATAPRANAEVPARRCAIRLVEIPADRSIDPKIILRIPPDSAAIRMPVYKGLPPCPPNR